MCRSGWWYTSLVIPKKGVPNCFADGAHFLRKVVISSWRIDLQKYVSWSNNIYIWQVHEETRPSHISPYPLVKKDLRLQAGSQHSRHLLGSQSGDWGLPTMDPKDLICKVLRISFYVLDVCCSLWCSLNVYDFICFYSGGIDMPTSVLGTLQGRISSLEESCVCLTFCC